MQKQSFRELDKLQHFQTLDTSASKQQLGVQGL